MPTKLRKLVGERVKALRKSRGLTQEELGQACGVAYKHVGLVERGLRAPSFELLEGLAKVLKVEPYQLFVPVGRENVDVDADITSTLGEFTRTQRAAIRRALAELLRVAKKLDA